MKILLVGGHYKAHFLAKSLKAKRHEVVVINDDVEWCKFLTNAHDIVCVCGDGTKPFILEDARAAEMDAVAAITNKDAENLVICKLAKKLFGVKRTLAVVNDPKNLEVFTRLGVDKSISATEMLSEVIESETVFAGVQSYLPLENGRIACLDMVLSGDSPVCGRALRELDMPQGSIVGIIVRGEKTFVPNGDSVLRAEDKIIVLTSAAAADDATALFGADGG
ncbi:MAG: TrkA family potassium uptake protein [Oscillospiraceae bacterium]|jgi:trk system potassium uptake protein TrkA|nr:TrkA family potassium uptake protein [Oscillospiraceae bacterium]